jgi:hypothetical protein
MAEIGFSMDGFRSNMINESNRLKESLDKVIEDMAHASHAEEVKEAFNDLARSVRFLCHTYNNEVENYTIMSQQSEWVELYEEEE